jgi:hypothetical protein
MKKRAHVEGLSVPATIVTAKLAQDTLVAITANKTVDKAGANAIVIGRVLKTNREANGSGTIETRFKELIEIKASGALVAGNRVKLAAADGGGLQRVVLWDSAADTADTLLGVVWKGGADAATVEVLTY